MSRDLVEHSRDLLSQFLAGKVTKGQVVEAIDWKTAGPPGEQHVASVWQCVFEEHMDICYLIELKLVKILAERSKEYYEDEDGANHNKNFLSITAGLAFCFLDVTKEGYNKHLFKKTLKIWMDVFENDPKFKRALIETGEWYVNMAKGSPYYKDGSEEKKKWMASDPNGCKRFAKKHKAEVIKPRESILKKIRGYK